MLERRRTCGFASTRTGDEEPPTVGAPASAVGQPRLRAPRLASTGAWRGWLGSAPRLGTLRRAGVTCENWEYNLGLGLGGHRLWSLLASKVGQPRLRAPRRVSTGTRRGWLGMGHRRWSLLASKVGQPRLRAPRRVSTGTRRGWLGSAPRLGTHSCAGRALRSPSSVEPVGFIGGPATPHAAPRRASTWSTVAGGGVGPAV